MIDHGMFQFHKCPVVSDKAVRNINIKTTFCLNDKKPSRLQIHEASTVTYSHRGIDNEYDMTLLY